MIEIERKFLVDKTKLPGCTKPIKMLQGYLNPDPERTVRIRIAGEQAFITIKGKSSDDGWARYEFEQAVPLKDAEHMITMCQRSIYKTRHEVMHSGKLWEVDVFQGFNTGLIVAEIELTSMDETFDLPPWVTEEVTGDPKYYNSTLSTNPFMWWDK